MNKDTTFDSFFSQIFWQLCNQGHTMENSSNMTIQSGREVLIKCTMVLEVRKKIQEYICIWKKVQNKDKRKLELWLSRCFLDINPTSHTLSNASQTKGGAFRAHPF